MTDANQPFVAYIFLPTGGGATGTMVVVNRQTDIVEAGQMVDVKLF